MAVSKRLKFEILRRDGHACRYCGAKAPGVELTVDHVIPKALGGTDDPSNLVAACRDCNSGKTSSSPDAPLVADVSDDAVRWASAIRTAQARMLADIESREAGRAQFAEWWGEHSYPKPDDWAQTVDQFIAAGLPLRVIKDCIDLAASRSQVRWGEKFRYMCGIAWKKVTELQQAAQSIVTPGALAGSGQEELAPAIASGRADLASELLGSLDADDIERLTAEAREDRGAETDQEAHIEAAHIAWQEARAGLEWLTSSICDLLITMQDNEVFAEALHRARTELYDEDGPEFSRSRFAERATELAIRIYLNKAAADYLDALPEAERAEWFTYAYELWCVPPSAPRAALYAARCARDIRESRLIYEGMCIARGEHIERCPARATHYLQFAEFTCCQGAAREHDPHTFCDKHTAMAAAGELRRNGESVTPVFTTEIAVAEEAVPFLWPAASGACSRPSGMTGSSGH